MWDPTQEARLTEIGAELETLLTKSKHLSDADTRRLEALNDEGRKLLMQKRNHQKALSMSSYASPSEHGYADTNPGDNTGPAFTLPGMENRIRPTSMYEMDRTQIAALKAAAQQSTPLRVQIGQKGIEHGNWGVREKSAITEGGLSPNLLPPIQQYGPNGFFSLPYELTRIANFLPVIAMDGAGVSWFRHDSNGAEAAYVAEGTLKPDLSPVVSEQYTRPSKLAARFLITKELAADAGDTFAGHIVNEAARSLYNAESNLLLNGTVGANGFAGINQVSGALTQAIGSDTALDCLSKAFVQLRNDFFEPDLCVVHPSTLGALRRQKDAQNRYLLDLMSGAGGISSGEQETLWGVPCVQSTQQSAGTAAVLSVKSGAAVIYQREAPNTFYDPYSQASSNLLQYIIEERLALATPRPSAICLVSGLPTS